MSSTISQVSICNSALAKVGADRISSIDEDNKRAKILKSLWDEKRDATLRAHPWKFAKKRVTLSPVATAPDWGYAYAYDIPNDWIRFVVVDPDDVQYEIVGQQLHSDEETLDMEYVYRHTDWSKWDSLFAEALACSLAIDIAYPLTQSAALVEVRVGGYRAALAEARVVNGVEGYQKGLIADDWTRARRR